MSFSELAWDRFREFQLEVWFREEQISETEAEQGVDDLKQGGFNIEYFYDDLEREIYKGLIDGRFRQEEIWDFHDSLDNQALTWLVRFMLLRMEGQYESVSSNNENRYEDFLERVQLIAKWKDRDTQEEPRGKMLCRLRQRRRRLLKRKSVKTHTALLLFYTALKGQGRSKSHEGLTPTHPHFHFRITFCCARSPSGDFE